MKRIMLICMCVVIVMGCKKVKDCDSLGPLYPILEVTEEGPRYGFMDSDGEVVIPPTFLKYPKKFTENYAVVNTSEGYGYIDKAGKFISKERYFSAHSFSCGMALVRKDLSSRAYFIDTHGVKVIDPLLDGIGPFSEDLARFSAANGTIGYIGKDGNIAINAQFEDGLPFSEGIAGVKKKGLWGFIEKSGNFKIEPEFSEVKSFSDGRAWVMVDNAGWVCVDASGQQVFERQFTDVLTFKEKLAAVKLENKWGYVDINGAMQVKPKYDDAEPFQEGLAMVGLEWMKGFIDKNGNQVIPYKYKNGFSFQDGLAWVSEIMPDGNTRLVYIDKKGNIVWERGK